MLGRKIEMKLVKNTKTTADGEPTPFVIPEEAIMRVTRDIVKQVGIGVIAVIGATVLFTTTGDVIVNSFDNHQKKDRK